MIREVTNIVTSLDLLKRRAGASAPLAYAAGIDELTRLGLDHFAGVPPGTSALMFKFVPQDTLARFGGPGKLAEAVDDCITELAAILKRPDDFKSLIMGARDRASRT